MLGSAKHRTAGNRTRAFQMVHEMAKRRKTLLAGLPSNGLQTKITVNKIGVWRCLLIVFYCQVFGFLEKFKCFSIWSCARFVFFTCSKKVLCGFFRLALPFQNRGARRCDRRTVAGVLQRALDLKILKRGWWFRRSFRGWGVWTSLDKVFHDLSCFFHVFFHR